MSKTSKRTMCSSVGITGPWWNSGDESKFVQTIWKQWTQPCFVVVVICSVFVVFLVVFCCCVFLGQIGKKSLLDI